MALKLGFAREDITPPVGTELGGYAGYRPCAGAHDPLWCKAVVLEQGGRRFALVVLDMLSVDESFVHALSEEVKPLGIGAQDLVAAAIHSHAAVCGMLPGKGPLGEINRVGQSDPEGFESYMRFAVSAAVKACRRALERMEPFLVRKAQAPVPPIGSERHTGQALCGKLTALQCVTRSGRQLILYQIPCHPTVLGPDNLLASADFVAGIEDRLGVDMAVFLGGAAGDISTRFTRREASFAQCDRFGEMAARAVLDALKDALYEEPAALTGISTVIPLRARRAEPQHICAQELEQAQNRWLQALQAGAAPQRLRILKSYVEGAGVKLELSRLLEGIDTFFLPVTAFFVAGMRFVTVPGELFSSLADPQAVSLCYANGYYRYLAPSQAYDLGYYEALAAIVDRGEGERFSEEISRLLRQLAEKETGGA